MLEVTKRVLCNNSGMSVGVCLCVCLLKIEWGANRGAHVGSGNSPLQPPYLSCANIIEVMSPYTIYLLTDF